MKVLNCPLLASDRATGQRPAERSVPGCSAWGLVRSSMREHPEPATRIRSEERDPAAFWIQLASDRAAHGFNGARQRADAVFCQAAQALAQLLRRGRRCRLPPQDLALLAGSLCKHKPPTRTRGQAAGTS